MKLTDDNYVELAEAAIQALTQKKDRNGRPIALVTTSKIRNLLAMTAEIYNEVINSKSELLSSEIKGRINYLKIRFVYEAGRDEQVKNLVIGAKSLEHLDEIKGNRGQYILFSRYMEALVAYRKYYGGKDE